MPCNKTNSLQADIVVLTGTSSPIRANIEPAAEILGRLRANTGARSPGNHEFPRGADAVTSALRRSGIEVLSQSAFTMQFGGASLYVAGVDDYVMALTFGGRCEASRATQRLSCSQQIPHHFACFPARSEPGPRRSYPRRPSQPAASWNSLWPLPGASAIQDWWDRLGRHKSMSAGIGTIVCHGGYAAGRDYPPRAPARTSESSRQAPATVQAQLLCWNAPAWPGHVPPETDPPKACASLISSPQARLWRTDSRGNRRTDRSVYRGDVPDYQCRHG